MNERKEEIPAPGRLYHFADQALEERWRIESYLAEYGEPPKRLRKPSFLRFGWDDRAQKLEEYFSSRERCTLVPLDPENYSCLVEPEHEGFGDNLGQILHWHARWPIAIWIDCQTGEFIGLD